MGLGDRALHVWSDSYVSAGSTTLSACEGLILVQSEVFEPCPIAGVLGHLLERDH